MTVSLTPPSSSTLPWAAAIAHPAPEFEPTSLPILAGQLPPRLQGTLYRNGPGRLERGGDRVGHWFDGDGAILAVHFGKAAIGEFQDAAGDASAAATYRYVKTPGYMAEAVAGKYLYSNYGMCAPGPFWTQWTRGVKNAANTSVLALPDQILALWEGGLPYGLDPCTLETQGPQTLGGLSAKQTYSAHPKREPATGHIFNFGVQPGPNAKLHLYRSNAKGTIQQQNCFPLEGLPLIHDFVLAGPYLVFCISPVRISILPAGLGLKSLSDAMVWQPELGTHVLIFSTETLELVSQSEVDPWYQWHFGNGFVDSEGLICIDVVRYPDFQTNQRLKEVATGRIQTPAQGTLWRTRIEPLTAHLQSPEPLLEHSCEFPTVPPHELGQPSRHTYLSLHRQDADLVSDVFGAIARYDHRTQTLTEADCGPSRYPTEPIYAPDPEDPDRGWILTVVFDGEIQRSEVWIFDSDHLAEGPVCRLGLPSIIPHSFHGTWRAALS